MPRRRLIAAIVLAALLASGAPKASSPGADVLVFAASSLQDALDALVEPAAKATGVRMRISYAASSALARQIESGAPAELFVSADLDWMDGVAGKRLIKPESRRNLLGNRLVLVAPKARPVSLKIAQGFGLAAALGRDRLALADPSAVPAGKYAKAALTSLGVWNDVQNRIAAAENVRAALRLVARGEAPLGIVYKTDALADPEVVVVDTFPESSHPPIVYPAALTTSATPEAAKLLAYLDGAAARAVFDRLGFTRPR